MTDFEQKQIEQLKRIADVLEDMNGALISMSTDITVLSDCVGQYPPTHMKGGKKYLRIDGTVDALM